MSEFLNPPVPTKPLGLSVQPNLVHRHLIHEPRLLIGGGLCRPLPHHVEDLTDQTKSVDLFVVLAGGEFSSSLRNAGYQ